MKRTSFLLKAGVLLLLAALLTVAAAAESVHDETTEKILTLFETCTYEAEDGYTMGYRLYVPADYDAAEMYPLVLFLHGAGERGDNNTAQLTVGLPRMFDDADSPIYEAIVIAPQCPADEQWVDTPWADGNYSTADVPESKAMQAALAILDKVCASYSVNKHRLYVTGLSMGGFGTWDVLARHGDRFAAGMPLCGGGDSSCVDVLSRIPIRTFHGTNDDAVPVAGTREMYREIKHAVSREDLLITYREMSGYGHGIWDVVYGDRENVDWLFSQGADLEPEPVFVITPAETTPESDPAEPETTRPIWIVPLCTCLCAAALVVVTMIVAKGKRNGGNAG